MINQLINKIYLVLDASGSMKHLKNEVIKVFDSQISYLIQRSNELRQETRISVYLFNTKIECLMYDKDVLRIPNISNYYKPDGNTRLIDANIQAIEEARKSPELYGDYGHLLFCLSDGLENASSKTSRELSEIISKLPENWTICALVPDQTAVFEAKQAGFPAGNIQVWSTTEKGIKEVGEVIKQTTDSYMDYRSKGIRGTKCLFNLNTSNLNTNQVKTALQELSPAEYQVLRVSKDISIKEFVESWNKVYVPGSAYYELTKSVKVQNYKNVIVQDRKNGKLYTGPNARTILGLPDYEVTINPANHSNYRLFFQSSSLNRKLLAGTELVVLK